MRKEIRCAWQGVNIAKNATVVVEPGADGKMVQLRAGTNGWVCMAHPEVMCLDKEWQGWADAWMNKKDPQIKSVGIAYMLKGDKGASNTDPFATAPTATNQWVVSPSHVMVLTPDTNQLEALPTDPHNGGPWVMWKGKNTWAHHGSHGCDAGEGCGEEIEVSAYRWTVRFVRPSITVTLSLSRLAT